MSQHLGKVRYEANTLKEAKYVAKVWKRMALFHTPIHIRRGRIVRATIHRLDDSFRFYLCHVQEQERKEQKQ